MNRADEKLHQNFCCGLELNTGVCKSGDTSVNTRLKIIFSRTSRSDLGLLNVSRTDHLTGNPFIFHLTEAGELETIWAWAHLLILGPVWSAPVWSIQVFLLLLKEADPSRRSGSVQLKGFKEGCRCPSISSVVLQHLNQPETTY